MKDKLETEKALEQLNITSLFGKEILEKIQKTISEATGLAFVTIDYKGEPVTELTSFTPFCQQLRKNGANERICRSSDAFGSISSAVTQKPFVYLCPCGLLEVAIPLIVREHYLGGFIGGQVMGVNLPNDIVKLENLFKHTKDKQNTDEMQELFKQVPKMSYEKFLTVVDLISVVIGYLGEKEVLRIQNEEVFSNDHCLEQWQKRYQIPTDHLKKLMKSIDENDFPTIYYNIPKVIEELYAHSKGDSNQIQMAIRELQSQFIHSVDGVDMSRYFEEIEGFDSISQDMKVMIIDLVKNIYLDENLENSVFSLEKVDFNHKISVEYWFFQAVDYILQQRLMQKSKKIQRVFCYINQNINENIGLSEITQACDVSQGYLSRIFRQNLNTSVMNYLHMKKIYLAKAYFCLTDFSVTEVTYQLGYNEVSYFTKVFKKYEQMTVNQYKLSH